VILPTQQTFSFTRGINMSAVFSGDKHYKDYSTELRLGNIKGRTNFSFGGRITGLGTSTETLWNQGGTYVYLASDTQLYISSSSTSDTAVSVVVAGLDDTGAQVVRTVAVNGRTQVALSGLMWRVFAAQVVGATDPVGDLYIAETDDLSAGVPDTDSKIKSKIDVGTNLSAASIYTIPAGKKALFKSQRITVSAAKAAQLAIRFRTLGGVWITGGVFDVFEKAEEFNYSFSGQPFPPFTDIEITAAGSASGVNVTSSLDGELIDI